MTTYLSPGVYVEEVPSGPQPIAAAPTSVVAVLGTTRRGPVKEPTRVTGWADFVRTFGSATSRGFTGESVFGFFENGGPAAWIVRVDPSTGASWTAFDVSGTESFDIEARLARDVGQRPDGRRVRRRVRGVGVLLPRDDDVGHGCHREWRRGHDRRRLDGRAEAR